MRVAAHIEQPHGILFLEGEQPFLVVGAAARRPLDGPWIVVDADGHNAVRHSDDLRAVFDDRRSAGAVVEVLNRARAA